MRKEITCLLFSICLAGCSDSGSSDDSASDESTGAGVPTLDPGTADTINSTNPDAGSEQGAIDTATNPTDQSGSTNGSLPVDETNTVDVPGTGSSAVAGIGNIDPAASGTQIGFVSFDRERLEFEANFQSLNQQARFSQLVESFRAAEDTCEVTTIEPSLGGLPLPTDPTSIFDASLIGPVSAGEVLTIRSSAGSYAELLESEAFGVVFYELDENAQLTGPAPSDLSISIPGDGFPAFTNVGFPQIEDLVVTSPGIGEFVTASTNFAWNPGSNPGAFIEISAFSTTVSGTVFVECIAEDDGSFSFPAATQSEMASFTGTGFYSREAINVVQSGSSFLIVTTTSEP